MGALRGDRGIVYLGLLLARTTGEARPRRPGRRNTFDELFLRAVAMGVLLYANAIPYLRVDHTSLPLSVGILSGPMWLPFSWIIGHRVGTFHTVARTALVATAWSLFPSRRFVVVPAVGVAVYMVTIVVLEGRWRRSNRSPADRATAVGSGSPAR